MAGGRVSGYIKRRRKRKLRRISEATRTYNMPIG